MSAAFIPMVSTTPPPMSDDEDFTDFAEFPRDGEEFSSALDEDSFSSYPTPEIHSVKEDFQTNEFANKEDYDDGTKSDLFTGILTYIPINLWSTLI